MSSLTDILTTAKNIVTAINGLGQTFLSVNGTKRSDTITASTVVTTGQGRLVGASVVVPGSSDAIIYDSTSTSNLTSAIAGINNTNGFKDLGIPFNNGLVVVPGTGMTLVLTYSER